MRARRRIILLLLTSLPWLAVGGATPAPPTRSSPPPVNGTADADESAPSSSNSETSPTIGADSVCDGAPAAPFTDTAGSTFRFEIDCLHWYGLTQGSGDGTVYRPLEVVTRAQMATLLWRTARMLAGDAGVTLPSPVGGQFDDIGSLPAEMRRAINGLATMGVVSGTTASTFDPGGDTRRDQMASFVNRTQGALQELQGGDPDGYVSSIHWFSDVPRRSTHTPNINGLASRGIVRGRNDGTYGPAVLVTRGQIAAYIVRWLQVVDADTGPNSSR